MSSYVESVRLNIAGQGLVLELGVHQQQGIYKHFFNGKKNVCSLANLNIYEIHFACNTIISRQISSGYIIGQVLIIHSFLTISLDTSQIFSRMVVFFSPIF